MTDTSIRQRIKEILSKHFWYNLKEKHLDQKGATEALEALISEAIIEARLDELQRYYDVSGISYYDDLRYLENRLAQLRGESKERQL